MNSPGGRSKIAPIQARRVGVGMCLIYFSEVSNQQTAKEIAARRFRRLRWISSASGFGFGAGFFLRRCFTREFELRAFGEVL